MDAAERMHEVDKVDQGSIVARLAHVSSGAEPKVAAFLRIVVIYLFTARQRHGW